MVYPVEMDKDDEDIILVVKAGYGGKVLVGMVEVVGVEEEVGGVEVVEVVEEVEVGEEAGSILVVEGVGEEEEHDIYEYNKV